MSESRFAMISDWMVNGNINNFVKVHPDANRLKLVGVSIQSLVALASLIIAKSSSWKALLRG